MELSKQEIPIREMQRGSSEGQFHWNSCPRYHNRSRSKWIEFKTGSGAWKKKEIGETAFLYKKPMK